MTGITHSIDDTDYIPAPRLSLSLFLSLSLSLALSLSLSLSLCLLGEFELYDVFFILFLIDFMFH